MADADNALLVDAHRRAMKILTDARETARTDLFAAHQDTMETLLLQQDSAARLLLEQVDEAVEFEQGEERKTAAHTNESRTTSRDARGREAASLSERQLRAAEILRRAQVEAAGQLQKAIDRTAAETLLVAQVEAAEILLKARRQVLGDESD